MGPRILWGVLAVKFLELALDALVDLLEKLLALVRGEVALSGVDRFALAAVDGDEFNQAEVQLLAQPCALPADLPQGCQGVLPEVRNRLVSRSPLLQPPQQLDIPGGLLCQATTRTETGERAVYVELQQISRVIGRPSRSRGGGPRKAERRSVEAVDKGIDETDRMLFSHVVVQARWEQALFVSVRTLAVAHAVRGSKWMRQDILRIRYSTASRSVFTQSGAAPDCLQLRFLHSFLASVAMLAAAGELGRSRAGKSSASLAG